MKVQDLNILRAVARECLKEMDAATKGVKSVKDRDAIRVPIIQKHYRKVEGAYRKIELVYAMGVIRGTLKERE